MPYRHLPVLFLLTTFLFIKSAIGQTIANTYVPKIIPTSPNAAAVAKFGDYPISPYTGTTDISIPVYTVTTKSISIPVSLSYHTGGVRVSEESGWVGLGWALNAGGMISRTINDKDDFTSLYFNTSVSPLPSFPEVKGRLVSHTLYPMQEALGVWAYNFACRYKVYSEIGIVDFFQAMPYINLYDMEPDSYTFYYPGGSGKFIIDRQGKVILQKQENLKIQYTTGGASFSITDEQGNIFYYLDKEYSQPATGGAAHICSWMLSKVMTHQKDSVTFNYHTDSTWSTVKGIVHETLRTGVAGYETPVIMNDVGQSYLNKTLLNIDCAGSQVQFSFDGNRSDLQNGKKLNSIRVFSKDQNGLHYLKEEQLYYSYFYSASNDALEFKRLKLDSVKPVSGSASIPPYSFIYQQDRDPAGKHSAGIDHWGYFNGASNTSFTPPFAGIVNIGNGGAVIGHYLSLDGANREPSPPQMQAFSLKQVTYPTGGYTLLDYEPNYYDYNNSKSGRDGRDFEHVALISKTVQVKVNRNGTYTGTVDFSDIYLTSGFVPNAMLSIAFRAANSDSLSFYHNSSGFGKINFTFQNNITDISNSSLYCSGATSGGSCKGTVYATSTPLVISSPSVYNWSGYIDPTIGTGFMDITATFTYQSPVYRNSTIMMASGLRIKSITDYSAQGIVAKKRNYDYSYQEDRDNNGVKESYSYGRLMGFLTYARYEPIETSREGSKGVSLTRYSSNLTSFTSLSSGNIVGYDQVTEYTIDPLNGNDNGKTVYNYYNSSDTSFSYYGLRFPGMNNLPNNLNGLLQSKSVFKRDGQVYSKVLENNYYYHSANRVIYDCMKFIHLENSARNSVGVDHCERDIHGVVTNQACFCPLNIDSATYQLAACFYPALSSEKVLLDSTVEKLFDPADTSKFIANKIYHYYDNPVHYQITRNKTVDSKLNKHVTLIKYPQDYSVGGNYTGNAILDSLIDRNMIGSVIEKQDSLYYAGATTGHILGAQLSKYRFLNQNVPGLDKQYQLSLASPVTDFQPFGINGNITSQDARYRQMISFDNYDNSYNILQFTTPNQSPSSFIYGYNNQYPVANIVNATCDQVAYSSFESRENGNWNNYTGIITTPGAAPYPPTGVKYYNLTRENPLSKRVSNGHSYIISYWSRNGIYEIEGGGSPATVTGETIDGWTYYEQKVTAAATMLTITGTGAIDEVRLYPFDAQMTSYTYDSFGEILSACDLNSRIVYYEYDDLHRLIVVRDQDKNVIKKICYSYTGEPSSCHGITSDKTTQIIKINQ